ncbi:MAG: molybdopterin molybdotransferase MoeA [Woeseiaceae bacterium]|jgi:molybdopterin molybdotransferase|nr:molybdopterin molybdotransferase MoeA [Woeseiaceae bacterium]
MLTTNEARARILAAVRPLPVETVPLSATLGRVLKTGAIAERNQPPFDRVMMDGIALRFSEYDALERSFPIQGTQMAGDPPLTLEEGHCIEIMTGAALPEGADLVIPVEQITVNNGAAHVQANYMAELRQFIHARGSDYLKGKELLRPGTRIRPMDVAILASCGLAEVDVAALPAVTVISTGDELVPAGASIEPQQIRMSNGPAVVAMLAEHGYTNSRHDHLPDDKAALTDKIGRYLDESDVLVLSGGVSRGKADYVPEVLADLGVSVDFHRIAQRPGKPMWFGLGPRGQAVFALPGNPVSTLVCCRQYVIPALGKASGELPPPQSFANLSEDVSFEPNLTCFLPVRVVTSAAGQSVALPVRTNTSGDFASLTGTDGYVELAMSQSLFKAGTTVPLFRW